MPICYVVQFVSVDGAGRYDACDYDHLTRESAIQFAESRQATSDEGGNPYGYRYNVLEVRAHGPSRVIYRTHSTPHQPGESFADYRERRRQANPQS